jgi:acyl-CoA thioesterase I
VAAFNALYPRLAAKYGVLLYPFFLEGVAGQPALLLPDRLHPTEGGVEEIVKRILPTVQDALKKLPARRG